jgi:hypothetical protein
VSLLLLLLLLVHTTPIQTGGGVGLPHLPAA